MLKNTLAEYDAGIDVLVPGAELGFEQLAMNNGTNANIPNKASEYAPNDLFITDLVLIKEVIVIVTGTIAARATIVPKLTLTEEDRIVIALPHDRSCLFHAFGFGLILEGFRRTLRLSCLVSKTPHNAMYHTARKSVV